MDTKTIIIAVVVLAILVAIVLFRIFANKDKEKAKDEAIEFLNTLADKFEAVIIRHIKEIDFKNLDNLTEVEQKILDETINALWVIVHDQLTTYVTKDSTRELLRIIIDKDFLLNFIVNFFNNDNKIQKAYEAKYNEVLIDRIAESMKLEDKTVKENYEYSTEDISKIDKVQSLDPNLNYDFSEGTKDLPGKVIDKNINPQSDISENELTYSTEDTSVEEIEENEIESKLQEEIDKQE